MTWPCCTEASVTHLTLFSRLTCAMCGLMLSCWKIMSGCCPMGTTWGRMVSSLYFTDVNCPINHNQRRLETTGNGTPNHNGPTCACRIQERKSLRYVHCLRLDNPVSTVRAKKTKPWFVSKRLTLPTLPSVYVWTMMTKPNKAYLPTWQAIVWYLMPNPRRVRHQFRVDPGVVPSSTVSFRTPFQKCNVFNVFT